VFLDDGAQRAASKRLMSTSSLKSSPVKARGDQRRKKRGSMAWAGVLEGVAMGSFTGASVVGGGCW
jgi:hypothetical protein